MKKRNCRMTSEEKKVHEFAVKVRKMTDRQIYDYVTEPTASETRGVSEFINVLEGIGIKGVGTATIRKIKDFAVQEGFCIKAETECGNEK